MNKKIQTLGKHVVNNKGAWLMGVINVIASGIIASGGVDISRNTNDINKSKETTGALHKRITEQQVEIGKLQTEIKSLENLISDFKDDFREDINNVMHRIDSITRK